MNIFNPHMMIVARDARGLTQAELSSRLGIGQGTCSKFENGLLVPTDEFIDELARVLEFKRDLFFEPGRPHGIPPFHFRKRKKLSARSLNRIVAEINLRRLHIKKMMTSWETQTLRTIPEIDADEYRGISKGRPTIEDIAIHLRQLWGLPDGPVDNMVELIESCGGIVIPSDFGTDLIDAMSQRIDGMPVLFFVNINSPGDRIRFTLAHELGHMVLHTLSLTDDDKMEAEADLFAGSFLVPSQELKHQLRRFDLRQLANLKLHWKVSMQALAMRADQMNLITPYQKKMFWIEMGKLGYRTREPHDVAYEKPKVVTEMVRFHQEELGYSRDEMANLLHLHTHEYVEMYGGSATFRKQYGHLRVVN